MRKLILLLLLLTTSSLAGESKITTKVTLPNGAKGLLKKEGTIKKELEVYDLTFSNDLGKKAIVKAYKLDNIYLIQGFQLKDGKLIPIRPKIKNVPVDISFLQNIDEKFKNLKINNISGKKGEPVLYFIFDAYCPYCINDFNKYYSKLEEKYEVHFIPFAIHGERSVKAMACMFNNMKNQPADKVLKNYFSKAEKSWVEYSKQFKQCISDKKVEKAIIDIRYILRKNHVKATPTFIYQDKDRNFHVKVGNPLPILSKN